VSGVYHDASFLGPKSREKWSNQLICNRFVAVIRAHLLRYPDCYFLLYSAQFWVDPNPFLAKLAEPGQLCSQ